MQDCRRFDEGDAPGARYSTWQDLYRILLLLVLATIVRVWHISHTEVTARDGVGFIRYAWDLEHFSWKEVLRSNPHPPLYPLTILAVSLPTRRLMDADDVLAMQLSGQIATGLAGVVLVIPMFLLGKALVGSRSAFWASALFQCLPASTRVLSDALSEGIWLLLTVTALLIALWAFRNRSWIGFGASGICSGLAYLARPEGMLVAAAIGAVLVGAQLAPRWRVRWPRTLACAASLSLGAFAVAAPYCMVIGRITNKTTGIEVLQAAKQEAPVGRNGAMDMVLVPCRALASPVGVFWLDARKSEQGRRLVWGLKAVAGEYIKGFGYFAWLPALIGVCCARSIFRRELGAWAVFALCLLYTLALWRVAYVAGYVSERHSLPVVMFGLYWMAGGVDWICAKLAWAGRWLQAKWEWTRKVALDPQAVAFVLLVALAGGALPKSLEPLHANRAGFHAAGVWLAEHASSNDAIVDPFAWAEYYAGRALQQTKPDTARPTRSAIHRGRRLQQRTCPAAAHADCRSPGSSRKARLSVANGAEQAQSRGSACLLRFGGSLIE